MVNCNDFQNSLSFNVGTQPNLLSEVREFGRLVRHSHDQKINDIQLVDIFYKLRIMLEDRTELANRPEAQHAVEQLKQLQSDEFKISTENELEMLKEGLRLRLHDHYQATLENMPISPILAEKDAKLRMFYVAPKIVEKNHRKIDRFDKDEGGREVKMFSDVFCHEGQLLRNVVLVGEPGKGKSTFSAICALEWTHLYSQTVKIIESKTHFADSEFFREFEFLFHVTLRDSGQSCNLTEMVQDQLICKIYNSKDADDGFRLLQTVLESEKCLIIADGLDEWTHPENVSCTCRADEKHIPFQKSANKATVLTTTRPWRLAQFRVKDSKIDKYLEIEGADKPEEIVKNIVTILNANNERKRDPQDFMKMVFANGLQDLLEAPNIITQLVCLWFEGVSLTDSKCNIYAGVINMLSCRHRCVKEEVPEIELPSVIQNHECFTHNPKVYLALAKLAYTTLFSVCRESSVVFSSGIVDRVLDKRQVEFALKSGLLTEKKSNSFMKRTSHFSFFHKTVQEFLSALHLCLNENDGNQLMSKYEPDNKQIVMGDVFQVFIFICGMKPELGVLLSSWINSVLNVDTRGENLHLQSIISGFHEANSSNFGNIPLTLTHFIIEPGPYVYTLKTLMNLNMYHVQSLVIYECDTQVSAQELQDLFSFSGQSLKNVMLEFRNGEYDLSMCHRLECLSIRGDCTKHVQVDTTHVKTCTLRFVSSAVESDIFSSFKLERRGRKLQSLNLEGVKNVLLLCDTLLSLSQLQNIRIAYTDFRKLNLLLPASITSINLHDVTMTAGALRTLEDQIENSPHTVKYEINGCNVKPDSE